MPPAAHRQGHSSKCAQGIARPRGRAKSIGIGKTGGWLVKFACPKCKTKYTVADAKIPPDKTLRFTCKKCANVFRLKRKAKADEAVGAAQPNRGSAPMPQFATRVDGLHEIMAVKKRSKTGRTPEESKPHQPAPASPFVQEDDWFVLISGKQQGPMSGAQVEEMLRARKIDRRTYAWRDGMGDWARLGVVPEFEDLATGAGDAGPRKAATRPGKAAVEAMTAQRMVSGQREIFIPAGDRDETVERAGLVQQTLAADDERRRAEELKAIAAADITRPSINMLSAESSGEALLALMGEPTGQPMMRDEARAEATARIEIQSPFRGAQSANYQLNIPTKLNRSAPHDPTSLERPSSLDDSADYLTSSPGQETRIFMATAGIYRRRRMQKIAGVTGGIVTAALATFVVLDLTGAVQLPGMGKLYEATGLEDPNMDRAMSRAEEKLQSAELTPEERAKLEKRQAALRAKLLGKPKPRGTPRAGSERVADGGGSQREAASEIGIEEAENVNREEHDLTAAIMGDDRKKTKGPKLRPPSEILAPNLPKGLTQEAIFEVINKNQRAMSLCISQSMKAGENVAGKMEVEMSINASGQVDSASIQTDRFHNTTIGNCTVKTVKRWRFPRFNGKPVTVIFPYVLSASM